MMEGAGDGKPVKISEVNYLRIKKMADWEHQMEICGYLVGKDNEVAEILPMKNMDQSLKHFSFDPVEQFDAFSHAHAMGLDLIGVYHSHPASPARMSDEDINMANDAGIYYLIYSSHTGELKAFKIDEEKKVFDIRVEITSS